MLPTQKLRYAPPPSLRPTRRVQESLAPELPAEAFSRADDRGGSWAPVLVAGLSLLGVVGCTQSPASPPEMVWEAPLPQECPGIVQSTARVVVLDDFANAETATTHGELVEVELSRFHNPETLKMERQQVSLHTGDFGLNRGERGALGEYLRDHFAGRMERGAEALERLLASDGPRAVLHQSQGASQSRVVDELFYKAGRNAEFRAHLQQQLGLGPGSDYGRAEKRELLSRLVQEVVRVASSDARVLEARQNLRELQDLAHQEGHIHVISAGNNGYLGRDMERLGVEIPPTFFSNDLASEHSIVVGASDDGSKGWNAQGPHRPADLASPNAGAHLAADGVDRPLLADGHQGFHSGSSYAAPQVSDRVLHLLRSQPDISRDEILRELLAHTTPVPGAEATLGAGVLSAPTVLCVN